MNDEFLYRLRVDPPRSFAQRLKARLDVQAASAAARARARNWYLLCGVLLGTTAFAIAVPSIRDLAASWWRPTAEPAMLSTAPAPRTQRVGMEHRAEVPNVTSRSAELSAADAQRNAPDEVTASPARSAAGAPKHRPVLFDATRAPADIAEDMQNGFQEAYGFPVERQVVSQPETICARGRRPAVVITMGRMIEADRSSCTQAGLRFIEVTIGFEAYVALVRWDNTWAHELTIEDLRRIGDRPPFDPTLTTWNQIRPDWPSLPIDVFGLVSTVRTTTQPFATQRRARALPIAISKDDGKIPGKVGATYGGLGFMSFATYEKLSQSAASEQSALPARLVTSANERGERVVPSRETIANGTYDLLSRPLMLYVAEESLWSNAVELFATHAIEGFSLQLADYGFTPIDEEAADAAARKIRRH